MSSEDDRLIVLILIEDMAAEPELLGMTTGERSVSGFDDVGDLAPLGVFGAFGAWGAGAGVDGVLAIMDSGECDYMRVKMRLYARRKRVYVRVLGSRRDQQTTAE